MILMQAYTLQVELKYIFVIQKPTGLEINGNPGARDTEIMRRSPRLLRLGSRQAPAENAKVGDPIYIRAPGFWVGHRDFSTSEPGRHRSTNGYGGALGQQWKKVTVQNYINGLTTNSVYLNWILKFVIKLKRVPKLDIQVLYFSM